MPTMNELVAAAEHTVALRKFRQILVFVGSMSAPEITALTDAQGAFLAVDAEYLPVGMLEKSAGVTFPRSVERSETEAINHGDSVREDSESDEKMVKFRAIETTKTTLELAYGLDLSGVTGDAASGEVSVVHPELPDDLFVRMLILGLDPKYGVGAGKFYPRLQPMDFPEIKWGPDAVTGYDITGKAFVDDTFGYSFHDFPVCGPGSITHRDALGFPASA